MKDKSKLYVIGAILIAIIGAIAITSNNHTPVNTVQDETGFVANNVITTADKDAYTTCYDGDKGNKNVRGITMGYLSGSGYKYTDYCLYNGVQLREYDCKSNQPTFTDYSCASGCSNGKCN